MDGVFPDRIDPIAHDELDPISSFGVERMNNDTAHVLLVGDMEETLAVAKELARGGSVTVGLPNSAPVAQIRFDTPELVMVEVPVDMGHLLQRLRASGSDAVCMEVPVAGLIGRTLDEVERAMILGTLSHCRGNRTSASTMLGISVRTMRNKLRLFQEDGITILQP